MSLRKKLSDTLDLIDRHPDIPTIRIGKAAETALSKFLLKFEAEVKKVEANQKWEDMAHELVNLSADTAAIRVSKLSLQDFQLLCAYMKQRPCKATKKLNARLATECKLLKKLADIRKQTL